MLIFTPLPMYWRIGLERRKNTKSNTCQLHPVKSVVTWVMANFISINGHIQKKEKNVFLSVIFILPANQYSQFYTIILWVWQWQIKWKVETVNREGKMIKKAKKYLWTTLRKWIPHICKRKQVLLFRKSEFLFFKVSNTFLGTKLFCFWS